MDQEEFKEFMAAQTDAIEVAKWLLGEKLGYDPGEEFVKIVKDELTEVKNLLKSGFLKMVKISEIIGKLIKQFGTLKKVLMDEFE